jgi:hypothetical protein
MIKRRSSSEEDATSDLARDFAKRSCVPADAEVQRRDDDHTMPSDQSIVDLADRHSHDLDVVLMWARQSGRIWVTVTHRRSGRTARINATAANALDVFRHPFAYERAVA